MVESTTQSDLRPARYALVAAFLGCAVIAAALLFFFNPAQYGFYPKCMMKATTGLDCPGCGGLRATHQLLHGRVAEAFTLNPLLVLAIPVATFFGVRALVEKLTGRRWPRLFKLTTLVWIGAAVVVLFGVLRNLPW